MGFVSADWHQKATLYLCVDHCERGFRTHRDLAEVFIYATTADNATPSPWRARARAGVETPEHFVELHRMSPSQQARRVVSDEIDVLVDMDGYSNEGLAMRELFAWRLAPLQVSWFVFMSTTGSRYVDYIVADAVALPKGSVAEKAHSEAVLELPHTFFPISHRALFSRDADYGLAVNGKRLARSDVGIPKNATFVYGSFNKFLKMNPALIEVWCRIVRRAGPKAHLLLLENPAEGVANVRRACVTAGLDASRVHFAPFVQTSEEHLPRVALCDVVLDTPPYGAHTGAADAFWAGVPVVTTDGACLPAKDLARLVPLLGGGDGKDATSLDVMSGRVAASLASALGVADDLVAFDLEAYEELAVRLSTDKQLLQGLRAKLEKARDTSPAYDAELYAKNLLLALAAAHKHAVLDGHGDAVRAAADESAKLARIHASDYL